MGNFQELKVWQRAKDLAVEIYKITNEGELKKDWNLKDQLRRSAVSVVSNIAEGDEFDPNQQSIRHFYISKVSLAELRTQLIISYRIGYISDEVFNPLDFECKRISVMFNNLIKHRKN